MSDLSIADVDQAGANLRDAKATGDPQLIKEAKEACQAVRSAWRLQEEAAGNRDLIGGDAVATTEGG